jgi:glutamyl-tRNA synthetase
VVIDDHLMGVSHVLRAEEWIPSGPIQVRLYQAFGWREPVWVHLPLVLDPNGGKLKKREKVRKKAGGATEMMTQVREYRAAGYLPEAMFNFLARLGWAYNGDEEIF